MATFALIHGGGDVGWSWHLVEDALRRLGHDVVAPDLPCDDDTATLWDYADRVVEALGDRQDVVVVGHSYGGFTAPLVAARRPVGAVVYVAGMVPRPQEPPAEWWTNTGHAEAVAAQAALDGVTGSDDPWVACFHDLPPQLAEEADRRSRGESAAAFEMPWPLDALPGVPARFVLCTGDRVFPAALMRRVAAERLGLEPDELDCGHYAALARPDELAALLDGYVGAVGLEPTKPSD